MYQNHFIYFPTLYFCFATSPKPILPAQGFPAMLERLKFMDFERRATANKMQFTKFCLDLVSKVDRLSSHTKCGKS